MWKFPLRLVSAIVMALASLACAAAAQPSQHCLGAESADFSEVLACYKKTQDSYPLDYHLVETQRLPDLEKRSFRLSSQNWSPRDLVSPARWQHTVDIYIPTDAIRHRALLVTNNGISIPAPGKSSAPPTDFTEATLLEIARKSRTIVISVSDVPNQYLTYTDDQVPRREDSSVAHSWQLFLKAPESNPFMTLHLPMAATVVKTVDLAQAELKDWQIDTFVATGTSKRAWAVWLAAIADSRINAIVPFVIDILNMDQVLEHTWRTYGKQWPLAFRDYHEQGITRQRHTPAFAQLRQIEDPLAYLDSAYAERLSIDKYIVNASGDDFFVPDNARFYLEKLPAPTALRVAPNSSHYGISAFTEQTLISALGRWQSDRPLPVVRMEQLTVAQKPMLDVKFSEAPSKVVQWTAHNPLARDFRHSCGIRYVSKPLQPGEPLHLQVPLATPDRGWTATFVEATFADGFVSTTPVVITPDSYPAVAPAAIEPACKTLADQ
jgi:PhoPQ-activated pathogenicity-related protein